MMTFAPPRQEQQCRPISWFAQHIYPALRPALSDVGASLSRSASALLSREWADRTAPARAAVGELADLQLRHSPDHLRSLVRFCGSLLAVDASRHRWRDQARLHTPSPQAFSTHPSPSIFEKN